jgi:hypothetical protein
LTANLATAKEENKKLIGEALASKEVSKAHEDNVSKLNEQIKTLEASLAQAKSELNSYHKEMCKSKRKAALAQVDVDEAKVNDLLEKFASASDELFDEFVKAMPKKKTDTTTASMKDVLEKAEKTDTNVVVPSDTQNVLVAKASEWFASTLTNKSDKKGE